VRVYTAWWSEADQRAAGATPTRVPPRPAPTKSTVRKATPQVPSVLDEDLQPYERIAADLRGAIDSGILTPRDPMPTEKALASRYGVAASTAHRAVALLVAAGLVTASRGKRATVAAGVEPEVASVTELRLSDSS
jgi:integrase